MDGIRYLVDEDQKPVAVQIDLEKYGNLWEDTYDVIHAQSCRDEDSIPLEDLVDKLKAEGKLDTDV